MFHPTLIINPTGTRPFRADIVAEVTTALDAAGVSASTLLIGPDRVLVTVDSGAELLATLLILDLEPIDSAGPDRYAKGIWRGIRVVVAHSTRYAQQGFGAA
jgi:hypothetical protein